MFTREELIEAILIEMGERGKRALVGGFTGAGTGLLAGGLVGNVPGALAGAAGGAALGATAGWHSGAKQLKMQRELQQLRQAKGVKEELLTQAHAFLNEVVSRRSREELGGPWNDPEDGYSARDHLALLARNPGGWRPGREQQAAQNTLQMGDERVKAFGARYDVATKGDWFKERLSGKSRKEMKNAFKRSGVGYPSWRESRKDRRSGSLDTLMTQWRKEHPPESDK